MTDPRLIRLLSQELEVDDVSHDVTVALLGDEARKTKSAIISAREPGTFSGESVIAAFKQVAPGLMFLSHKNNGSVFESGEPLVEFRGPVGEILSLERTLLNFLSHACGVATLTAKYVEAVIPYPTGILGTRKTLPGLRPLQLEAIDSGGGQRHRQSLSDGILIKDNHQSILSAAECVRAARQTRSPLHRIEVEVQSLELLKEVLPERPDVIMLDNFSVGSVREALVLIQGSCAVEVSGGVTLENVRSFAETGVDYVSVGRLTHSANSLDLTLDIS